MSVFTVSGLDKGAAGFSVSARLLLQSAEEYSSWDFSNDYL
jgi:hypothetical protein